MARILIVEDDRPFADALATMLQIEGHEVSNTANPCDGVELGTAQRLDVVIADWLLKHEMHGGEVCRRIRAAQPQVKTIVISGCTDLASQIDPWNEDVGVLIEKPFHKRRILDAVNDALSPSERPHPCAVERPRTPK